MPVKSTITVPINENGAIPYPRLKSWVNGEKKIVVLFTAQNKGVVLNTTDPAHSIGKADSWNEWLFADYNGDVILCNE